MVPVQLKIGRIHIADGIDGRCDRCPKSLRVAGDTGVEKIRLNLLLHQRSDSVDWRPEAIAVITRLSKQRKDSIEQFKKGGREDLVAKEQAELSILETYLPKLMDAGEVKKIAEAKKTELGITDPAKKGMLMSALMKDLKGKADGSVVNAEDFLTADKGRDERQQS